MKSITIVQLNDLHGYLEPHPEWFWGGHSFIYREAGGISRIRTVVEEMRRSGENVLFCDNGDTLHGTAPLVRTKGELLIPILNAMGLSAMTAHWDFAYGPDVLLERTQQLNYPLLAQNVYRRADGNRPFPPYVARELGGTRVAIIGIACNIVDKTMPPSFSTGLRFTDGREELAGIVEEVRTNERPDLVILLSHLGFPQDHQLVSEVPGVDICLSGHTHTRLHAPVQARRTSIVQAGCHGSFLTKLKIELSGGRPQILEHELITVSSDIRPDPEIEEMVQCSLSPYREELNEVVGVTNTDLNRATMLDSTADRFLLNSIRSATGTELAFSNGWRYGCPITAGPVTVNDLYNLTPMDPEVSLVTLTGSELVEMIEENLERTFSRDPFGQRGGYIKRCLGMTTCFKAENPAGARIQEMFVGDAPVEHQRRYSAAFITMQAVPEKYGSDRQGTGLHTVEAMRRSLAANLDIPRQPSFVAV